MYPSCSPIKVSGIVLVALLHGCALLTPGPTDGTTDTTVSDGNTNTIPVGTDTTNTYPPIVDNTTTPQYHVVTQGETLFGIAQLYGQTWQQIAQWNNIQPPYTLSQGQQLLVSMGGGTATGSTPTTTYPVDNTQPSSPVAIIDNAGGSTPAIIDSETGYYVVSAGDTLYSISRSVGYSVAQIASWNGLIPPYALSIGQMLIVSPTSGTNTVVSPPVNTTPIATTPPVSNTPNVSYGSSSYVVQAGDTLYSISRQSGYSVAQIASWNGLAPPYSLSVGQVLALTPSASGTVASTPAATAPTTSSSGTHVVAAGQTLYSIARQYGSSVAQIASVNGLIPPYTLSVGQTLSIPSGGVSAASIGGGSALTTRYSTPSNNSTRNSISFHKVKQNETLASIARDYGLTTHELSIWNGIGMPYTVYPGQSLLIVPP